MRKDVTGGYGASSSVWCFLPESEMCAVLVVVANILWCAVKALVHSGGIPARELVRSTR
jgi:hypothetical protein